MNIKCKDCKSNNNCPTGKALGVITYVEPIYEYAQDPVSYMCREACNAGWVCTRDKGHNDECEAQTGLTNSKALARWEVNRNLRRID